MDLINYFITKILLVLDVMAGGDFLDKPGQISASNVSSGTNAMQTAAQAKAVQQSGAPVIRKKERAFMGMFEYNKEDESIIVRHLVYGTLKFLYNSI